MVDPIEPPPSRWVMPDPLAIDAGEDLGYDCLPGDELAEYLGDGPDLGAVEAALAAGLTAAGVPGAEAFSAVSHALRDLGGDAPIEALVKAGLKELNA